MELLTLEEIKQAAKESDEAALRCSITHYHQVLALGPKDFEEAKGDKLIDLSASYCALCQRFYNAKLDIRCCQTCPLTLAGYTCFDDESPWNKMRKQIKSCLSSPKDEQYSGYIWPTEIQNSIKAVVNALKACLNKLLADKKPDLLYEIGQEVKLKPLGWLKEHSISEVTSILANLLPGTDNTGKIVGFNTKDYPECPYRLLLPNSEHWYQIPESDILGLAFEYGDEVEVRDHDGEEWEPAFFFGYNSESLYYGQDPETNPYEVFYTDSKPYSEYRKQCRPRTPKIHMVIDTDADIQGDYLVTKEQLKSIKEILDA